MWESSLRGAVSVNGDTGVFQEQYVIEMGKVTAWGGQGHEGDCNIERLSAEDDLVVL